VLPFGVSRSGSAGGSVASRSGPVPKLRSVPSRLLPVRPSGVVLTFDVCRTAVAVRLASRLHLRPCTLRCGPWRLPAIRCPVGFPSGVGSVPGLASTLEDLAAVPVQPSGKVSDHRAFRLSLLPSGSPPLRRSQSEESTSRRHLPAPVPPARLAPLRLSRDLPASPRRGGPIPLRSAFAVSHDLDGLPFPGPCGVFQPLTPMGFCFPLPRSICSHARSRGIVRSCAGDGSRRGRLPAGRDSRRSARRLRRSVADPPWLPGAAEASPGRL
jgi:hypothetical protein